MTEMTFSIRTKHLSSMIIVAICSKMEWPFYKKVIINRYFQNNDPKKLFYQLSLNIVIEYVCHYSNWCDDVLRRKNQFVITHDSSQNVINWYQRYFVTIALNILITKTIFRFFYINVNLTQSHQIIQRQYTHNTYRIISFNGVYELKYSIMSFNTKHKVGIEKTSLSI